MLDLPQGFSYRVVSRRGDAMDDGGKVPDNADGMGCFALPGNRLALVRNHELTATQDAGGNPQLGLRLPSSEGNRPLPGGTTTLVLDARTLAGAAPVPLAGRHDPQLCRRRHALGQLADLRRRRDARIGAAARWPDRRAGPRLGVRSARRRRRPGAARAAESAWAVSTTRPLRWSPRSGMVFLTEDREDGLFYRFTPRTRGRLADGGRLQALAIDGLPDSRNRTAQAFAPAQLEESALGGYRESGKPRGRPAQAGRAARAQRCSRAAKACTWAAARLYFCCTSGGAAKLGQIFRLRPVRDELQLFFESTSIEQFNYGDNLTVAPNGHLVVCEDQYTATVRNFLRGITPAGETLSTGSPACADRTGRRVLLA